MNHTQQNELVEKIRAQYTGKNPSQLEALKGLDRKVKRPANILAYSFGTLSALIMGAGMSLIMTDIGASIGVSSPEVPGLIAGIAGMLMAIANYPIYKGFLKGRHKKYAAPIIALSDEIMSA